MIFSIAKDIIYFVVVIKYSKQEKPTGSLTCRFVVYISFTLSSFSF